MVETLVEMRPIAVLRVRADWKGGGPSAAFSALEAKLPTLKGRKFYGMFRPTPEGEEYDACVEIMEGEDPGRMGLQSGEIPGGWYARRKVRDWERNLDQFPIQFKDMIRVLGDEVDGSRPGIEFYRSQAEAFLFQPVKPPSKVASR